MEVVVMENNEKNSITNGLLDQWKGVVADDMPNPHAMSMVMQKITFRPGELFLDMAKLEVQEIERLMRYGQSNLTPEADEFHKYILTILWLRVQQVSDRISSEYKFARKNLMIPVRLYQIILSLGIAEDRDYGIRFVPTITDIDANDLMSPSELRDFSDCLMQMQDQGYLVIETGLPNDVSGELGFMACLLLEDERVVSYRKDHPVYGFIASFFKSQIADAGFTDRYVIQYGTKTEYEGTLRRIYRR